MQWWKIAVCVLGVLMIAGAVTYTLMTRTSASSSTPAIGRSATSATTDNGPTANGVGKMKWVIDSDAITHSFRHSAYRRRDMAPVYPIDMYSAEC